MNKNKEIDDDIFLSRLLVEGALELHNHMQSSANSHPTPELLLNIQRGFNSILVPHGDKILFYFGFLPRKKFIPKQVKSIKKVVLYNQLAYASIDRGAFGFVVNLSKRTWGVMLLALLCLTELSTNPVFQDLVNSVLRLIGSKIGIA